MKKKLLALCTITLLLPLHSVSAAEVSLQSNNIEVTPYVIKGPPEGGGSGLHNCGWVECNCSFIECA